VSRLDLLDIGEIHTSAINVGSGTVNTEHGVLPVPAPATAALLEGKPIYARGPAMELTTPTGAAIAATLSSGFGPLPAMRIERIGHGAGDRDFTDQPNVLRVLVGQRTGAAEATLVSVLEANIDDSSPQVLAMRSSACSTPERSTPLLASPDEEEPPWGAARDRAARRSGAPGGHRFRRDIHARPAIYLAERRAEERRMVEVETSARCASKPGHRRLRARIRGLPNDCFTRTRRCKAFAAAQEAYLKLTR
jgi:hypothetical protein